MNNTSNAFHRACLTLARSVASHRVAQNLTQGDLAGLSGVHANAISKLENDPFDTMNGPSLRTIVRLSEALGVPLSVLFDYNQ